MKKLSLQISVMTIKSAKFIKSYATIEKMETTEVPEFALYWSIQCRKIEFNQHAYQSKKSGQNQQ